MARVVQSSNCFFDNLERVSYHRLLTVATDDVLTSWSLLVGSTSTKEYASFIYRLRAAYYESYGECDAVYIGTVVKNINLHLLVLGKCPGLAPNKRTVNMNASNIPSFMFLWVLVLEIICYRFLLLLR